MPLSRRYSPEWYPGDSANIGMDFSAVIPAGVGIASGNLLIRTNSANPADASADFTRMPPGALNISGRTVYTHLSGGVNGRDYLLVWEILDTDGNFFSRTAMMLCAPTS